MAIQTLEREQRGVIFTEEDFVPEFDAGKSQFQHSCVKEIEFRITLLLFLCVSQIRYEGLGSCLVVASRSSPFDIQVLVHMAPSFNVCKLIRREQ